MAGHLMMLLLRGSGVAGLAAYLLSAIDGNIITDQTGDPLRTTQDA